MHQVMKNDVVSEQESILSIHELKLQVERSMTNNLNDLLEGSEDLLAYSCRSGDQITLQLHADNEEVNKDNLYRPLYRVYRLESVNGEHEPDSHHDELYDMLVEALAVYREYCDKF